MRVWTIRTLEELEDILQGKTLRTPTNKIDRDFLTAYNWMAKQLNKKITAPEGTTYPIWIWKRPKPDLRKTHFIKKGSQGVRLELEIPEEKILLSDFDGWHNVLNNAYHCYSDEDDEAFESFLLNEKNPEIIEQKKQESWKKIFEIDNLPEDYEIQGVTWEILPEYLVNYKIFTGR